MNQAFATFMGILIYGLGKHSLDTYVTCTALLACPT